MISTPLRNMFRRSTDKIVCSSVYCPGANLRDLTGHADLVLPPESDEDNILIAAISYWSKGGDQHMCDAMFIEVPTHSEYMAIMDKNIDEHNLIYSIVKI